jgi:hypothetical protein
MMGRSSFVIGENGLYERIIRKRKRKSGDQLKTLVREFERNPNWTKDTLLEVSRKLGLAKLRYTNGVGTKSARSTAQSLLT